MTPLRIAWLTTGRGPGSYGALEYTLREIERGLPVEIAVVFVNRGPGEAEPTDRLLEMVERAGIPVETMSSVAFRKSRGGALSRPGAPLQPWRREYDEEAAERLARYEFSVGIMFGYMLIATEPLFSRYTFLNDHPALPDGPVGTYQDVILDLIERQETESGCMMNVVTGDVDRGPVTSFCRYPIRDVANEALWRNHNFGLSRKQAEQSLLYLDIRKRGVERERPFLAQTLRAIAEGGLGLPPKSPVDLTPEVEGRLRRR